MNFLTSTVVWTGAVVLKGFVLKVLWGWFIVPLGVVAITIPNALGLSVIIAFLIYTIPSKKINLEELMTYSIGVSLFALLFGFIVQLFM